MLEGAESVVRLLYVKISTDTRHERVSLLEAQPVAGRTFARWAMTRVSEDGEPDIPLLMNVNKGGISPAGARPTTPEQDAVLERTRAAVRDGSHV